MTATVAELLMSDPMTLCVLCGERLSLRPSRILFAPFAVKSFSPRPLRLFLALSAVKGFSASPHR